MSARDDGGPAFPMVNELGVVHHPGMSLRDVFACHALAGMCASLPEGTHRDIMGGIRGGKQLSAASYTIADAMLEARKK